MKIDIVNYNYKYLLVNKPSGVLSDGFSARGVIPQVTKFFKQLHPERKLYPKQFQLVQRLDRFVTGGMLISRNKKLTQKINQVLRDGDNSKVFTRRYVGLVKSDDLMAHIKSLPKSPSLMIDSDLASGTISYDIRLPSSKPSRVARTDFKILYDLLQQVENTDYPLLFNSRIYPLIFQLHTGRKNQIREHCLRAFKLPLLNDDKFESLKYGRQDPNSTAFKSNQIGLHCGQLIFKEDSTLFPIHCPGDRILWKGFVDDTGSLSRQIQNALTNFQSIMR